jgi:uncharacterized coiled-coil protein SlyX
MSRPSRALATSRFADGARIGYPSNEEAPTTMNPESIQDVRIELESKIAFQEKTIADLNSALVDHTRTILELAHRVELVEKVVRGLSQQLEAMNERPTNEKPPHY